MNFLIFPRKRKQPQPALIGIGWLRLRRAGGCIGQGHAMRGLHLAEILNRFECKLGIDLCPKIPINRMACKTIIWLACLKIVQ